MVASGARDSRPALRFARACLTGKPLKRLNKTHFDGLRAPLKTACACPTCKPLICNETTACAPPPHTPLAATRAALGAR